MSRTTKPLTDTEIKKAQVKEKEYKLSDGNGLYLVIKTNGTKFFRFDFSYGGKRKSMSFGVYPGITLKEARDKREESKKQLSNNTNPISEKKLNKISEEITLNYTVDNWLELKKKNSSEATYETNKRILRNITLQLGNIAIKDIKRINIIEILQKIQNKGRIETAHRLFSILDKVYKFAVTNELIEHNIMADIDKMNILIKNQDNHLAAITKKEDLKQLLFDINDIENRYKSDISTIYIFKLIPYIFVRSANIRLMEWTELDLKNGIWDIPKEKMKMDNDFIFPLPTQAIKLIKEIEPYSRNRSKYVFPSQTKNDRGVSGATLSETLNKLGYQNKHSFHGFRSTFSTIAHEYIKEHGFNSDIIEACLSHQDKNKVRRAYNRVSKMKYFEEKKQLIEWYSTWLDNL